MSLPQSIPSKISGPSSTLVKTPDAVPPSTPNDKNAGRPQTFIYITAILNSGNIKIDGKSVNAAGPIGLSSPIKCRSFETANSHQLAYYIK
tara:strand:- start:717 stop:989 length:273 start_codon:yes stop_codon:yes gene_type:complete